MHFLLRLLLCLSCCGLVQAHIVQQLFIDFDADSEHWQADIRFDAGIALPEMRADKEAPQPKRAWLVEQSPEQHDELKKQAEIYLRDGLTFNWESTSGEVHTLDYQVHFPEWATEPPYFRAPYTDLGFAYFSVVCTGQIPKTGGSLTVKLADADYPDFAIGFEAVGSEQILTVYPGGEVTLWQVAASQRESDQHANAGAGPTATQSFGNFLHYGYRHVIPDGWDHVLFIAALTCLSYSWRSLLSQSLVFTLGHTLTLGLSITGVLHSPSEEMGRWIEICIAGTIVYVALENLMSKEVKAHRLLTIFGFGLIHGLGFASVLGDGIRSSGNVALPLIAANLGVELGQITVIALMLCSLFWLRRKAWFPRVLQAVSLMIACVGSYWIFERLGLY